MRLALYLLLAPLLGWTAEHNPLLPHPQEIRYGGGNLLLRGLSIRFASAPSPEDRFAASELSSTLSAAAQTRIPIETAGTGRAILLTRSGAVDALPLRDERPGPDSRESYSLKVTTEGAEIRARSSAGLFYGVQTLRQLVEGWGDQSGLPAVEIRDWPALAYRGFMMDTSHGPLPTESEIKRQIDFLARFKANQYYFYSEASIEVKGYSLVNPGGRYPQAQVRRIIEYARERHVDVVPCMEFFGHMHDLFRVERYSELAPLPYGGEFNPRHPQTRKVLEDWIGQMATLFPSPWFHIGFDEPWALEQIGSQAAGGVPPGKLFLEHFQNVAEIVRKYDKRLMFWADMISGARIFSRYPELIAQLPPGTIAVPWHYRPETDYSPVVEPLAKAGIPMVVAPAVWNWNEVVPSFETSFSNIGGLLAAGRRHNALGLLNTGWTDCGQVLYRMSLPGMAYGAIASWQSAPVDRAHFFLDYARQMYTPEVAAEFAPALEALTKAQETLVSALGGSTFHRFWDEPFAPRRLQRLRAREKELRQARLLAEEAQERLERALELKGDPTTLSSLLLGARMLDYLGMKNLYAIQIAGFFEKLRENPSREQVNLLLRTQVSAQDHGLLYDLMDTVTELRERYREAWLSEYTRYRLGTALGRWDAEYEYWRAMQARFGEILDGWKPGEPLPELDAFRPKR